MKTKTLLKNFGTSLLGAIFCLSTLDAAQAQVSISTLGTYTQDFNTLPQTGTFANNATIPGWYISGATTNTLLASTGTDETPGVKNYGSLTAPTDRALGIVRATNAASANLYYGCLLQNNTNGIIRSFQVSYAAEQWREPKSNKITQTVNFDFQKGVTSLTAGGTWSVSTGASSVTFATSNGSGPHYRDGNLAAYRQVMTFTINLVLQPGEQVMLRWTNENSANNEEYFVALDDVTITPVSTPQTFYSKSTGNLDNLANWGTSTTGTGTGPLSFIEHNQTLIVNNHPAASITNSLTIGGINSKLEVGNGTNAAKLTIPAGKAISGEINVANNATLQVDGSVPVLGTLGNTSTVIFNGAAAQDIPQRTYGNLTVSGTGTKVLLGNTTVNGVLNFTGANLSTSNPATTTLTLGPAATINETSTNYFKGKLVKSAVISGAGTHNFGGMGLELTNTTGNWGTVTVTRTTDASIINPKDNTKESIKRSWNIQPQNQAGTNVNLKFNWLIAEDNGQNYGTNVQGQPWKSTDGGLTWIPVGNLVDIQTNGDVRTASVTTNSFSIWTMSGPNNPLPVSWLSFNGKATEKGNMLTWSTASEKNSESFIVERSVNGKTFEAIGTVKAAGNSNQVLTYNFTDKQPFTTATAYYRLKQTDTDGAFEYSTLVAIAKNDRMAKVVSVYPNPFGQTLNLQLAEGHAAKKVVLLSLEGKEVYSKNLKSSPETTLNDLPNLKAGVYFLKLIGENETTTLKVMRQ